MARYRQKDETDLAWNKIRRSITRDLDTKIIDYREELLNRWLTEAWNNFSEQLETQTLAALTDEASEWISGQISRHFAPYEAAVEAALVPDAD
jgi:hypothetical protein